MLITESCPESHKWLVVTYDIGAGVITPHLPLDLWVGAAQRTNLEIRGAFRVGLKDDAWYPENSGLIGLVFNALSLAGGLVPEAGLLVRAGRVQLVGPIGADYLYCSKIWCSRQ